MSNKEYRPTLAQLRTFVTIAENKHFGTAASKLNISQPSLSQALVALETGLGIQLIERSTRKVIVTPTGEELLPLARATLEAAEAFVSRSRGALGILSGTLTLGIIPTLTPYILPEFLENVGENYPNLKPLIVEEQTGALVEQLRDGSIDVAVLALPTGYPGMRETELFREKFVIVTPEGHPFAGRHDLTLDALGDLELLLLDDGHCLRDQIVDLCRIAHAGHPGNGEYSTRASSLTTIMQLVVAGHGSTLVPESAVATECVRPGLGLASFDANVTAERTIGLVSRPSSARAAEHHALGELITRAHARAVEKGKRMLGG
ncbi:LysR family transcriptional regulator [Corynebacterium qintianiae]|uniref:Probable hydrogen peroxide-inducible genes activator n=1 Tax=Corynebacterium qintianiae TaxID=2709392 RepID=A0A7T0KLZ8_9CORY|nr:hydrogen peroxide-inducible genes activator [Corynebacterium qintianiae]QPK82504.1 LysR family transcriptional regulator [Corynebacterium qintianiae]